MLPAGQVDSAMYVVIWVADDPSEVDGAPTVDANGVLTVRAQAYGPGGTKRMVEATVARMGPPGPAGGVLTLSWRAIR
jgi:hypothetical protein